MQQALVVVCGWVGGWWINQWLRRYYNRYYLTHGDSLTPMQSHNITSSDHLLPFFALTVLPAGIAGK